MATYTSNVTSAFVDLATLDTLEDYLYGGDEAVTYFVRQHIKSTWFSQVPVVLAAASSILPWRVASRPGADLCVLVTLRVERDRDRGGEAHVPGSAWLDSTATGPARRHARPRSVAGLGFHPGYTASRFPWPLLHLLRPDLPSPPPAK